MANCTIIEGADDEAVAAWLHRQLSECMAETEGPVAITVPGGSTPFPIMERLVEMSLAWDRLLVWPGDDRAVPEDHPASNTGRIRSVFEPAGAEVVTLTIMEQVPHFALAWLGMGADGHIASLFPASDARVDDHEPIRRLTPDPLPPEAPFDRITLTLPSLLKAGQIMFVIRGTDKREVFDAALRGENDMPVARLLSAASQKITCFA
ncbi:6-phosphogluconolactonase [Altererythrobacter sp. SALINAS58]|uniref:6-phosphogluconolactonase n=1 Tax=Alteripontixanthobacter muriae TaxID=2705546 RepID=UPI0015750A2F|nr:6-phosphogluconolactonase [Alteripontixanthobacter muriae]NTZ42630.1 6-phosphogluconolactonase [Alteripontixanthobacter muriae]